MKECRWIRIRPQAHNQGTSAIVYGMGESAMAQPWCGVCKTAAKSEKMQVPQHAAWLLSEPFIT